MPEKVDRLAGEKALIWVNHQAVLLKGGKNRDQVSPVCRLVRAGNQNIV